MFLKRGICSRQRLCVRRLRAKHVLHVYVAGVAAPCALQLGPLASMGLAGPGPALQDFEAHAERIGC